MHKVVRGPYAAEVLINKGVNILLTGHVGDKAEDALKRGKIMKIVSGLSRRIKSQRCNN